MILTPAAAKAVTARVTEAPPLEPAHQALGDHLVKALPMLLGNEDPDKHNGSRHKLKQNRTALGGKTVVVFNGRVQFLL